MNSHLPHRLGGRFVRLRRSIGWREASRWKWSSTLSVSLEKVRLARIASRKQNAVAEFCRAVDKVRVEPGLGVSRGRALENPRHAAVVVDRHAEREVVEQLDRLDRIRHDNPWIGDANEVVAVVRFPRRRQVRRAGEQHGAGAVEITYDEL